MNIIKSLHRIVALLMLVSFLSTNNVYALRAPVNGIKKVEQVLGTGVRGAERGYITAEEHRIIRQYLAKWYKENEGNLGQYELTKFELVKEGAWENRNLSQLITIYNVRIYKIKGMKEALEKLGVHNVSGHWAVRQGIVYIDEDVLNSKDGPRLVFEEIYELLGARAFADKKGWWADYDKLAKWLDEEGDPIEVANFLWKNHTKAARLSRENTPTTTSLVKALKLWWDSLDGPQDVMPETAGFIVLTKTISNLKYDIKVQEILGKILVRILTNDLYLHRDQYKKTDVYLDAIIKGMIDEGILNFRDEPKVEKLKEDVYSLYKEYFLGKDDTVHDIIRAIYSQVSAEIDSLKKALSYHKEQRDNLLRPVRGAASVIMDDQGVRAEIQKLIGEFVKYLRGPSFKNKRMILRSDNEGNLTLTLKVGRHLVYKLTQLPGTKELAMKIRELISAFKGRYSWGIEIPANSSKELDKIFLGIVGLTPKLRMQFAYDSLPWEEEKGLKSKIFKKEDYDKDKDHVARSDEFRFELVENGGWVLEVGLLKNGGKDKKYRKVTWDKVKETLSMVLSSTLYDRTEERTIIVDNVKYEPLLEMVFDSKAVVGGLTVVLEEDVIMKLRQKGFFWDKQEIGGRKEKDEIMAVFEDGKRVGEKVIKGWSSYCRIIADYQLIDSIGLTISDDEFMNLVENSLEVSDAELGAIIGRYHHEMTEGLAGRASSLKMIPALFPPPRGDEKGKFGFDDTGGTNQRSGGVELKGDGTYTLMGEPKKQTIPSELKSEQKTQTELFDFIAGQIADYLLAVGWDKTQTFTLGVTWSFPIGKTSSRTGIHMEWTKGWATQGVVGEDPVRLLEDAIRRCQRLEGYDIQIAVLDNDTEGTLAVGRYKNPDCVLGVILSTGTNAALVVKVADIPKLEGIEFGFEDMVVNQEWGAFDKLRMTHWDRELDRQSENPGKQILEKQVSAMYIGELARIIFKEMIDRRILFNGKSSDAFDKKYHEDKNPSGFRSEDISEILKFTLDGEIRGYLNSKGIEEVRDSDIEQVKNICTWVTKRAARIATAAILASITRTDTDLKKRERYVIAMDSSLCKGNPIFQKEIEDTIVAIAGVNARKVSILSVEDGSGVGAAILASVADNMKEKLEINRAMQQSIGSGL